MTHDVDAESPPPIHAESGRSEPPCARLPLEQRVEAILLGADRPLGESRLVDVLGLMPPTESKRRRAAAPAAATEGISAEEVECDVGASDPVTAKARKTAEHSVRAAIAALNAVYESSGRSFRIEAVAGGWQMMTLAAYGPLLARLRGERLQTRLSQAALETLSIIAYRQPILRADLESIRGVACGEILKSLMDRRLVRIVGRAEEVGRPMLYGTTREFLRVFGLATLEDLPRASATA